LAAYRNSGGATARRLAPKRLGTMLNPTDMTVKDGIPYFDAQLSASKNPRL
jgi:hypothetical protein